MKEDFNTSKDNATFENGITHPKPSLTVDVEKYQAYLDGADMTEEQKEEFLHALWSIIVSFVDLGFGVHPMQSVCGEDHDSYNKNPRRSIDMLVSEEFNSEN